MFLVDTDTRPRRTLCGRRSECAALDRLLGDVRAGRSGVLVVRGDPGVGKTALLDHLIEQASGCRIVRAAGAQSEMELAFAGLHQLSAPVLDRVERLPDPQREALDTAFGLTAGDAPDRFLVGLATLSLLAEVADDEPLLCVVDDAHWLDRASAQALAFAARRLCAEPVAFVFATREPSEELTGLPELVVEGLDDADARTLLGAVIGGPLDERVRDRIVAETRGNPLALLDLPRGLSSAELAGGFGLPDALPLSDGIDETFLERLAPLPAQTRRLLLVAAAEPVGDPVLVWRAAERLGLGVEAAAPATAAGLVDFGARVRFRHALVRSTVYRAAPLSDRQSVHRALAEATDSDVDPDRRAWHRAQAAPGPDEDVADELERSAGHAQARGGLAAASAFLEQAAGLTLDPARRARRALAAGEAKLAAGAPGAALRLLATAQAGPLDELEGARVDLLRARIAFAVHRGSEAVALLLAAAKQLEPLDAGLAREAYLDAFSAAMLAGGPAGAGALLEVAEAARAAGGAGSSPECGSDLLLDGLVLLVTEGYAAGKPILERALRAFRSPDIGTEAAVRRLGLACHAAVLLWDDEAWDVLSARHVELARDAGALTVLTLALGTRIGVHLHGGRLAEAASLIEELQTVGETTGCGLACDGPMSLAAWQGREADVSELIETGTRHADGRGEEARMTVVPWATALLYNGLGRHEDALSAAALAGQCPQDANLSLLELIEAASRSGQPERATDALERVTETTSLNGTDWALGIEARSRALLTGGEAAERLYREAIDRLGHTGARVELARTHLVYGEWLRRERRRLDAREQLRTAHEMLTEMGIDAFARRAERELAGTGETARLRSVETGGRLTDQEARIARLARDGLSNPQIGSHLYISPRTVEYHLRKVFGKLDISSRNEIHRALPQEEPSVAADRTAA